MHEKIIVNIDREGCVYSFSFHLFLARSWEKIVFSSQFVLAPFAEYFETSCAGAQNSVASSKCWKELL